MRGREVRKWIRVPYYMQLEVFYKYDRAYPFADLVSIASRTRGVFCIQLQAQQGKMQLSTNIAGHIDWGCSLP